MAPPKIDEKGQALFEFIVFLPFLIYLFTIMVTISNSINASINQQKATRGYFFYTIKGNSMAPTRLDLRDYASSGLTTSVGMTAIGWRERTEGLDSVAPCFKFSSLFKPEPGANAPDASETCEEPSEGQVSQFVRVFTLFGVCGATYSVGPLSPGYIQYNPQAPWFTSDSCVLR